jgi:hypothetical protein
MRRSLLRTSATFDEAGQAIVFVVVAMIALVAVVGLVTDIGYAFRTQRALQAGADASALAGAQQLPDPALAAATATQFGAGSAGKNKITGVGLVTEDVQTSCVTTIPGCTVGSTVNAISVDETATVPAVFAKILGFSSFKLHAKATACSPCGSKPVDIMLVLDRTGSMCRNAAQQYDCTDLNNAKDGIRTFLAYFDPAMAHIGLAVLPPARSLSTRTAKCAAPDNSNNDNYNYNSATARYLVVPLSSDFRNADKTLNTGSNLVDTVGCVGGGGSTSYANAIDEAQKELTNYGNPNVRHVPKVIVFFSDGAANTGPNFVSLPSTYRTTPCHQGIASAAVAKTAGTTVYSIGYALGQDLAGCTNANGSAELPAPTISVTSAMTQIASDPSKFFNKPTPGQLQSIYTAIAQDIARGSSSLIG